MYNQEIKERFIAEHSTSETRRVSTKKILSALEPYERERGMDICAFPLDELQGVVEEVIGAKSSSKRAALPALRGYAKWCLNNGIEGATDNLLQIKDIGVGKLKRQTVASPRHLQRYLDTMFEPESEGTVDCIYRCFYWLAYAGLEDEDALRVEASDVDITSMSIEYKGIKYPIYREAIPAFTNCINLTRFRYKHPNITREVYKERGSGSLLLRGYNDTPSMKTFRVEMSRKEKQRRFLSESDSKDESLMLNVSYQKVWLSGMFYRTYEDERAGMPPDFQYMTEMLTSGKEYKGDDAAVKAAKRRVANEYLEDYNRWKEAYAI